MQSGARFWSGSKRFPTVAELDTSNPMHVQYIKASANILACNFGLRRDPEVDAVPDDHEWRSDEYIKQVLARTPVPEYKGSTTKIAAEGNAADEAGEAEATEFASLCAALAAYKPPADVRFEPADFEKDHDFNFHIDFIHAASNLRAANYSIPEASRHKVRCALGKHLAGVLARRAQRFRPSACLVRSADQDDRRQDHPRHRHHDGCGDWPGDAGDVQGAWARASTVVLVVLLIM